MSTKLELALFGACIVRVGDVEVRGAKPKALFALLATAPLGRRSRTFLQDTLWGSSCYGDGRQNLRRALSDLRKALGASFDELISSNNEEVTLDLSKVVMLEAPGAGEFLEGLAVADVGFKEWVAKVRQNPRQLTALNHGTPVKATGRVLPRVTVLPLRLVVGDPKMIVLGDWLAEEMCRSLSRSNLLTVISHLSSREFSGRKTDTKLIGSTLDVDYFLTGSLRAIGDKVIADMDFVDAKNGLIMWSRQISSAEAQFWDSAQSGVANVIRSIGRSIADEAITYVQDRTLPELDDHHLLIAGVSLMHRPTFRDFAQARLLLEEAITRSPKAAETHAWLGKWHILSVFNGWTTDKAGDTQKALDATARALDINPESSFGLAIDGFAHNNLLQRMDIAESRYDAALDVNPNESLSWLLRGALQAFQDHGAEAIAAAETARTLSPIDPFGYYYDSLRATAYLADQQYDKALELTNKSLSHNDRHLSTMRTKIASLHYLDRGDEANQVALDLKRRNPEFNMNEYRKSHPSADQPSGKRVIHALEAAGLT